VELLGGDGCEYGCSAVVAVVAVVAAVAAVAVVVAVVAVDARESKNLVDLGREEIHVVEIDMTGIVCWMAECCS
jgi:hypothetical protein